MNGAPVPRDPSPDQDQANSQVQLFEEYQATVLEAAADHGRRSARVGDPDAYEGAVEAIYTALARYGIITADDVVWPNRGNELGAAFSFLAKSGQIEVVGYEPSKRLKAHGRLLRAWRRS